MPRFLNTSTGEFEWHSDPSHVVYAILSHTWRPSEMGGEQSYDDVQAIQAEVAQEHLHATTSTKGPTPTSVLSHPKLSEKIKGVCKVAREAGFRLVWNDACCIDKSSSAELSEAINSMFEWYRLSGICYVYLEDVDDGEDPLKLNSRFRRSRWHSRGWTLQELIAPTKVEFLTKTWHLLSTKLGLATTLESITGIDFEVLVGQVSMDSVSVARRMSWAANRRTTRVEDMAYSLMGIFGIHMSPIYGEGEKAFLRLQEEIVRTIPDQSIFAWGARRALLSISQYSPIQDSEPPAFFGQPGLFATEPHDFEACRDITPVTSSVFAARLRLKGKEDVPPLHCVFTPQGVRLQLLCFRLSVFDMILERSSPGAYPGDLPSVLDLSTRTRADTIAVLQCEDENESLIALPLCEPQDNRAMLIGIQRTQPSNLPPLLVVTFRTNVCLTKVAVAYCLENVPLELIEVALHWHDSLSERYRFKTVDKLRGTPFSSRASFVGHFWPPATRTPPWPNGHEAGTVFRVAPCDIAALSTLGFVVESPLQVVRSKKKITLQIVLRCHNWNRYRHIGGYQCPQTIQLTLTLTRHPVKILYADEPDTIAQFSVVNFVGVPTHRSGGSNNHPYVMWRTPCIDGSEDDSPPIAAPFYNPRDRPRVIAGAAFTVHSDAHWEDARCMVRFLRVSLEYAREDANGPAADENLFWLSVHLSEQRLHTRSIDRSSSSWVQPNDRLEQTAPERTLAVGRRNETWPGPPSVSPTATAVSPKLSR